MKLSKQTYLLTISTLFIFISCTSLSRSSDSNAGTKTGNVLGDIVNSVMGKVPLSQKNMVGIWNFQGTSCAFETENLLKKAGGSVVASQVEAKFDETCKSLNIKESNTNFIFNADSTYTGRIGGVKISGKYTLDTETKRVKMSYLLGVSHMNATVVVSSWQMKLLFDADSILKLMKFVSQFTNNTSIEVLGKMADLYDGMLLGFDLKKQ